MVLVAVVTVSSGFPQQTKAQEAEISAEERERDARALFALASRHYETGRLNEAIEEYTRAYALFPLPALQFNLYLAHRDAGNLPEATASLRLYLNSDDTIDDEQRAMLQRRLALMEANATANSSANPEQSSNENEVSEPEVDLVPPHEDDPAPRGMSPVIGGVTLAVGGALLVGALIEGLIASGKNGELDDICTFDMAANESICPTAQQASIVSSFETHRNVAWGLFYSGVAIAATGTVLLLLSGRGDDEPVANLECGPNGCIGSLRGAF